MQTINSKLLPNISGGYVEYRRVPTPVLASITQVSEQVKDTTSNNDAYGDAAPHCNQYSHKSVTPKNGDRNAQWQQYSWGNWWDDIN